MISVRDFSSQLQECKKALIVGNEILQANFKNYVNLAVYKDLVASIGDIQDDLDDQIRRAEKQFYEIAVVGREKAGKSCLLNAWLQFNLLPSERQRCTYTTTEIRSCSSENEQKYSIEYFTSDEFQEQMNKTKTERDNLDKSSSRDKDLLTQEIDEIDQLYETIKIYLGKRPESVHFKRFDEVRQELTMAISDPGQARAVKKVCIWTHKLCVQENVIFYDVPGYDSPITLHKDQTKDKIAKADAILYAKSFGAPDLVDSEVEIMKITDIKNPYIQAKDKIIVALTFCDSANSEQEYMQLVGKHNKSWNFFGVPRTRIVPVCSVAEIPSTTMETQTVLTRLNHLNGGQTGLQLLKEAVNACISDSKTHVAQTRYADVRGRIRTWYGKLSEFIRVDCNVNVEKEITDSIADTEMKKVQNEWWVNEWRSIKEEFQIFYQTKVRPKIAIDAHNSSEDIVNFKRLYDDSVDRILKAVPAMHADRQKAIYISCTGDEGIVSPKEGNNKVRMELSRDASLCIDKISMELSTYLTKTKNRIIDWIRDRLWYIPEVRMEMILSDEKTDEKLLRRSFDALMQRIMKPAIDLFLRYPRSKHERQKVMHEYQIELVMLDSFLDSGYLKSKGIVKFLANGRLGPFNLEVLLDNIDDETSSSNQDGTSMEQQHNRTRQHKTYCKKGIHELAMQKLNNQMTEEDEKNEFEGI
jgi:GTPase Era involved in 16S rRNA processing